MEFVERVVDIGSMPISVMVLAKTVLCSIGAFVLIKMGVTKATSPFKSLFAKPASATPKLPKAGMLASIAMVILGATTFGYGTATEKIEAETRVHATSTAPADPLEPGRLGTAGKWGGLSAFLIGAMFFSGHLRDRWAAKKTT